MRSTLALTLATAGLAGLAVAHPNNHARNVHQHHKRQAPHAARDVDVPGPTVITYVLDGNVISAAEVEQGIANGTLIIENGSPEDAPSPPAVIPSFTIQPSQAPRPHRSHGSPPPAVVTTSKAAPTPATTPAQSPNPPAASPNAPSNGGSFAGGLDMSTANVNQNFPSGVSCGTFPSQYGAMAVEWLGLGGWTGIQTPGSNNGGFSNIQTKTGSGTCAEGDYCSYACPPGYLKSQWPSTQGATGQSVGGLLCSGGTLKLTNPSSPQLCILSGGSEVTVQVQNKLSSGVAVCRTDYPGTESETVPIPVGPGETSLLAIPNGASYYTWQGKGTSAQYYVNPAGVSPQEGCQWGSAGSPTGNFAPLNLGVGYSNGAAWLSIMQNSPTTSAKLAYSVSIQGADGTAMSGTCSYANGQYTGVTGSNSQGCTVSIPPGGTAVFVFED